MSSPCTNPINFPAAIQNRPGLSKIRYRIGQYSDFRVAMLNAIDQAVELRQWTHRGADDPGIALIEGAATLGDILTFYQELYANEAWIGTATWTESITNLVRLIGYRPAPGIGGVGYVAFTINGSSAVTIPSGFPLSAQLENVTSPSNFETSESIIARPGLSSFSLYAPTLVPTIYTGTSKLGADAAEMTDAGVTLKPNDRLMLIDANNYQNRQIVVVKSTETVLDQTVLTLTGAWQGTGNPSELMAYKLGRTFRAFGYNVPETQVTVSDSGTLTTSTVDTSVAYDDMLYGFPLERQVDDLSAGITMLVEMQTILGDSSPNVLSIYTALSVMNSTDSVGPMLGGVTRVAFVPVGTSVYDVYTDRRTALCHEVIGGMFGVKSARFSDESAAAKELDFFGTADDYKALDGRLLQFVELNPDGTAARVEEATANIELDSLDKVDFLSDTRVRRIFLSPQLKQFNWSDFPASAPQIKVFGNLAQIAEGKTQPTAVLGNGDARQIFQSFSLPKSPLTWLRDEASSPPRDPQIKVLVNEMEWTQVDTLFASGPKDQVFILREADDGTTWVQFGDGINGSRLPSGINNVVAVYRTEVGANGWLKPGAKPQPNGRVDNLNKLYLYNEITGGTNSEDALHIREAAPGRVEELNRLVSLSDYEYEALSLPVEKAKAVWDTEEGLPLLRLTVLLADGSTAQLNSVQDSMSTANATRGAKRFPVFVTQAYLEYVYLSIRIGLLDGYQTDLVSAAVANALGVLPADGSAAPEHGLFAAVDRSLGEDEYASRIEGTVQNIEGVKWVEVIWLQSLGTSGDPADIWLPDTPALQSAVSCASDRVLALFSKHLFITVGDA